MSLIPWSNRTRAVAARTTPEAELSDLFSNLFRTFPVQWPSTTTEWLPTVDIEETAKQVTVKAELPGVKREDVSVEIHGDLLTLRGEKKEDKVEKNKSWWRRESHYGAFARQIALPSEVDAGGAEAQMTNGVLRVVMPKLTTTSKKTIKID